MQRCWHHSTDVTQVSFIRSQALYSGWLQVVLILNFFQVSEAPGMSLCKYYFSYWPVKPTSSGSRSNSPHSSIYKPLPCSQFLKPIHLREVYPVKRWKKPDSSFHLSYCLFPCFTHSPPPLWSPLQNSFPACLHYSVAPFYSLASSVIFLFLFS